MHIKSHVLIWVFLAACAPGRSVLTLSVDAAPPLPSVSALVVTVTDGAKRMASARFDVNATLPPKREVSLVLPAEVAGAVTVQIDALDGTQVVGSTTQVVNARPSEVLTSNATLTPTAAPGGTNLGDACTRPCSQTLDSCSSGFPGTPVTFPGGYCSVLCDSGQAMGNCVIAGGDCKYVQGLSMCLERCNPTTGKACRAGYDCCDDQGRTTTGGWCAPSNSDLCVK